MAIRELKVTLCVVFLSRTRMHARVYAAHRYGKNAGEARIERGAERCL